ncbi:hypothetical protein D3C85_1798000 [compost metagenome]
MILDVVDDALETVFRGVHTDHHQAVLLVFPGPVLHIRQRVLAVDAVVGPEIHQHHFAFQRFIAQGRRVEPFDRAA